MDPEIARKAVASMMESQILDQEIMRKSAVIAITMQETQETT